MVAIFTGSGFGFQHSSATVLGGQGLLGNAAQGAGGEGVYVNAATGNLVLQKQDEFLVGPGPDIDITRTYNSLTNLDDDNNDKWRQSTDRRVAQESGVLNQAGSTVSRVSGDGSKIIYTWDGDWGDGTGAYVAKDGAGAYDTIVKSGSGWIWTDGDTGHSAVYDYVKQYLLAEWDEQTTNWNLYAYDAYDRLLEVSNSNVEYTTYEYIGTSNKISSVETTYKDYNDGGAYKTLTRVRYGYDGSDRLQTVTVDLSPNNNSIADNKTFVTTYSYDGSDRVNGITQSDGSSIAIGYTSGKVTSLTQTVSTGVTRVTNLTYGSGYTDIEDASGQTTRLHYDGYGNLTKITAPPALSGATAQVVEFTYNGSGDLTTVTDGLDNETTYSDFTVDGQAQTITDRMGNIVTRVFGSIDKSTGAIHVYDDGNPDDHTEESEYVSNVLLSETRKGIDETGSSVSQTTNYIYDADGLLRYVVSPEGRVKELERNGDGAVTSEIRYVEDTYSGTMSKTALDGWVGSTIGSSAWVERIDYTYDARLGMTSSASYSRAQAGGTTSSTDGTAETHYIYDQAGQLLSSHLGEQAPTTYLYDGMGRITATTNAGGGDTTFVFNDGPDGSGNHTTVSTTASGLTITETYNKAGDLISRIESGAITNTVSAEFSHDSLGRVRISEFHNVVTTSGNVDVRTYTIYDNAGRHVGEVSAEGYLTEYRYDSNNRLVGTIHYNDVVNDWDPGDLADPDNQPAITDLRPEVTANAISSWTVYDGEGRVIQTIAGDGATTTSTYDKSGRLQQSTSYFNKISSGTMSGYVTGGTAPTGTVPVSASPGNDATIRYYYDGDGQLVGTRDGEDHVTVNQYDDAGRLVVSTAYANATTASAGASFNTLTHPSYLTVDASQDRKTRFVYDSQGQLRYELDALNYATRYDYDSAGNRIRTTIYKTAISTSNYTFDYLDGHVTGTSRVAHAVYNEAGLAAFTIDPEGLVTRYRYDDSGRLVGQTLYASEHSGTGTINESALNSWISSNANASLDRATRTFYTELGQAAYVVNAEGYVTRNDFDSKGRVFKTHYYYNPVSISDSTTLAQLQSQIHGVWVYEGIYFYDSLDRVSNKMDGKNQWSSYEYHGNTFLITASHKGSETDGAEYDNAGRLSTTTLGAGDVDAEFDHDYDGRGLISLSTDAVSNVTRFQYDLNGRLVEETRDYGGENVSTEYEYNAFGEIWKTTDPEGNITHRWYDQLGRLVAERDAENHVTTTTYTDYGEVDEVRRWNGTVSGTAEMDDAPSPAGSFHATSFTYDAMGRVLTVTDALNAEEILAYNVFGDRITAESKSEAVTYYKYDRLGRVVEEYVAAPTRSYTQGGAASGTGTYVGKTYAYNYRNQVTKLREGYKTSSSGSLNALRTTSYSYDQLGQLVVIEYDSVTTISDNMVTETSNVIPKEFYTYDARGNITKFVDKGGAATFSYYDGADRKIAEIRQLTATQGVYTQYGYDDVGNLTSTKVYAAYVGSLPGSSGGAPPTPPSGGFRQTTFAYDGLNRMIESRVVSTGGNIISGTWNGSSYTTSTGDLVTTYDYDAAGNVITVTDPAGNETWSWYDELNRKVWQFDATGSVGGDLTGYVTQWEYDAESNVTKERRYANAWTDTPSASSVPDPTLNSTDDRVTEYDYDANGNRTAEIRKNVKYAVVDPADGSLDTVTTGDAVIGYEYNALGQVIKKIVNSVEIASYEYDDIGRLEYEERAEFEDADGNDVTPKTSYKYDALGNLTWSQQLGESTGSYNAGARTTTYEYGEGGRLLSTRDAAGKVHEYFYDKAGRLKKDQYERTYHTSTSETSSATDQYTEARTTTYDISGRALRQAVYSDRGGSFALVDYASFQYNVFGEVTQQGSGSTGTGISSGSAKYQVENQYDAAGRLIATNAGNGIWTYFGYDKNGNQTAAITSAGETTFSGATSFATALSKQNEDDVNATYTRYDGRNMAILVHEEDRELSSASTVNLETERSYNAFGEVASETNARGHAITYTYNTMGRMTRSESPAVEIKKENGAAIWVKPSEDYYYDRGGRLVATRDANGDYGAGGTNAFNATSKSSSGTGSGNLISYALLAGSGYDGSQALISREFYNDGYKETLYDIMGDARVLRDELYTGTYQHVTEQTFDVLGRLTTLKHNRTTNASGDGNRLVDNFTYDEVGQVIGRTNNNETGNPFEKTAYDALGRIVNQTDKEGYVTTTSYVWDGTLATAKDGGGNIGTYGGWEETTTYANSKTLEVHTDLYGREVWKEDLGSHTFTPTYDVAGRMVERGDREYTWYNTSLAESVTVEFQDPTTVGSKAETEYGYDELGQRLYENYSYNRSDLVSVNPFPDFDIVEFHTVNSTVEYDALGRLKSFDSLGAYGLPTANITYAYDAAGNIRQSIASYYTVDDFGNESGSEVSEEFWFLYDSRNRLILDRGSLSGTAGQPGTEIVRGSAIEGTISQGQMVHYNAAGERGYVIRTEQGGSDYREVRENYTYDGAGRVSEIHVALGTSTTNPSSIPAAGAGGTLRSELSYDKLGRLTSQVDYEDNGTTQAYERTTTFNAIGQVEQEITFAKKIDGHTYTTDTVYTYGSGTSYNLGAVKGVTTKNYKDEDPDGTPENTSNTSNEYVWFDGALQSEIEYTPDTGSPGTKHDSTFTYDVEGYIDSVSVNDGRLRNVNYLTNADGQIIWRVEKDGVVPTGEPREFWYRFNGKQLGYVSNNGTGHLNTPSSIDDRQAAPATGPFRNGASTGTTYADFEQSYDPLNSSYQGSKVGSYTVQQSGETLRSVALQLWGDASLWYKLAEANGLQRDTGLVQGRRLTVPAGVVRSTYNAATLTPYDANEAIGNVSPTTPKPTKNGCGVFGQILILAVAIAVTAVLKVPIATALNGGTAAFSGSAASVAGAAAAAAAGSVASQGLGVATGIQEKFSFRGVALAAVGAAVGAGVNIGGISDKFVSGALNGAARSAITQGIGVATGLQNKFSFAGVAAAGIGEGIGSAAYGKLGLKPLEGSGLSARNIAGHTLAGTASALANAATRSAISGTSFGDNITRALPDAIGGVIGRALGGAVRGPRISYEDVSQSAVDVSGHIIADPIEQALANPSARKAITTGQIAEVTDKISQNVLSGYISEPSNGTGIAHVTPYSNDAVITVLGQKQALDMQYWRIGEGVNSKSSLYGSYITNVGSWPNVGRDMIINPSLYDDGKSNTPYPANRRVWTNPTGAVSSYSETRAGRFIRDMNARTTGTFAGIAYGAATDFGLPHNVRSGAYTLGLAADGLAVGRQLAPRGHISLPVQTTPTTRSVLGARSGQFARNQFAGSEFQNRVSAFYRGVWSHYREEVTIRPNTASGPADFRIRVDGLGVDPVTNGIGIVEAKSSVSASLTPNQRKGFPLIERYGGVLVGDSGGSYHPAGSVIEPGARVWVVRPDVIPGVR